MNQLNRPIFLASDETKKVQARLESVDIDDIVTWEELSNIVGGNIQKTRGCLFTARKNLLNEKQMVFASIRGVGLKRIANADIVKNETMTARKIRKQARNSLKRLSIVDPNNLKGTEKTDYLVASATIGAISLCTSEKFSNISSQRAISNGSIASKEALKLFLAE